MKVAERIEKYGVGVCSNAELLQAAAGRKAEVNTMEELNEIMETLPTAQRVRLQAMIELMFRVHTTRNIRKVTGPEAAAMYAMPYFRDLHKEHFVAMFLDTKNNILGLETISIGSLTASVVHPREVFEAACRKHAAGIIVFHNHPSGDPTPSREDIKVTERLVKAGKIMDIPVLDHIVIGDVENRRFYSLKEHGYI